MLPKQITDLLEGYVHSFDSARPPTIEFRKAHTKGAEQLCQSGMGISSAIIGIIVKIMTKYMEERADYIWERLQHITTSIDVQSYPELNGDLKKELARHFDTIRQIVERELPPLFVATRAPAAYSPEIARGFDNILLKLNADVDLFCAQRRSAEERKLQGNGPTFNSFSGVYGNITNSQVTLNDFSSIYQVLRAHNIPREARNELEDIWDALQTAPPDKKQSWIDQAEKWVLRHKDALGGGTEIVSKAIGAGQYNH